MAVRTGNTRYQAWSLNAQAASLRLRGDYPNALDHYLRCKRILEQRNDQRRLAVIHSNLGEVLHELGEQERSMQHYDSESCHQ
ncbi:MAG: tetratricopeptide repeat protein [Flavobacteriales bacterium]|nr:tetratricopeptide repeat protein [Flavobacteriales bacterium]